MENKNQEIKITVEEGVKELVIRHGEAEIIPEPQKVNISGSITAPTTFIAIRKPDPEQAHVTFSRSKMQIVYHEFAVAEHAPVITGTLLTNPDLVGFNINSQKLFDLKPLAQFLKMNRFFFFDPQVNAEIVTKLNNFTATVTTQKEQAQDVRGNAKVMNDKTVTSNVPTEFTLHMPIFVGFEAKKFRVEVCFDSTDVGTKVWLESAELNELILQERDEIMNEELDVLRKELLVVIEQY